MDKVTVRKAELLEAVKKNQGEHRAIFEEALEGFKAEALVALNAEIARIKEGKKRQVVVMVNPPEDHSHDYARVVKMLEMSIADEIELDNEQFAKYVMDDWEWQRNFLASATNYNSMNAIKKSARY